MKELIVILLWGMYLSSVEAQEIYKWEDERGVVHYGDKPPRPDVKPFEKEQVPYSNMESEGNASPSTDKGEKHGYTRGRGSGPRPSPSLGSPKAWLDHSSGDFWFSGTIRNGGKGLCDAPAVEVAVIDELGSVDGNFEVSASPSEIGRGEGAEFSGKYFAPVGNKMSWEAIPRCYSTVGAIYGARKRGTLRITHSRTVRSKKLRTQ